MKVKISKLLNLKPSLKKLAVQDLPVKTAFKIGKIIQELNKEYSLFEDNKTKLFKKYGEEEKGQIKIKPENVEKFTKDLEELYNIEVKIQIEKIKLEEIGNTKLSGLDASSLDILIEG